MIANDGVATRVGVIVYGDKTVTWGVEACPTLRTDPDLYAS